MIAVRHGHPAFRSNKAWIAASLLVVAASCEGWCPGRKPAQFAQELVARSLEAVIVTPTSASLAVGETQPFSVTGLMSDGTVASVTVDWSATGGTVSATGLYTAGAAVGTFRVIAVEHGGTRADTSAVTVTPGAAGPTGGGLVVEVPGAPFGQSKWILLDTDVAAPGAASCPSDIAKRFDGTEVNLGTLGSTCSTEYSVFTAGSAPVLDLSPAPVTLGSKQVVTEVLPARWSGKLHVVTEYPSAVAEAEMERALAAELFDANRMGLDFVMAGSITTIDPTPDAGTGQVDPRALAIKGLCAGVAGNPGLRLAGHLNVMYVLEDEWGYDTTVYGYACVDEGFPDIIFIRQQHAPATLAHEIGHALSLRHAGVGFVMGLYGWTDDNVMQSSAFNPGTTRTTEHFSLGQAFRANFHIQSWLNTSGVRSGHTKACQLTNPADKVGSSSHWPCPLLQLEWP